MKVKDLVASLSKFDQELECLGYSEDLDLRANNELFRLFEVETVSMCEAERGRDDTAVPFLRIGKFANSEKIAFLNITSDF